MLIELQNRLESGKKISETLSDSILAKTPHNFLSYEEFFWSNLYSQPLSKLCCVKIPDSEYYSFILDYVNNGLRAYETLIDKISKLVLSETTCDIKANDNACSFLYLQLKSLAYRRCGYLYTFLNKIQSLNEFSENIYSSFSIAFAIDPRLDSALLEISQLCYSSNSLYAALFYALKGVYGVANPANCEKHLIKMIDSCEDPFLDSLEDFDVSFIHIISSFSKKSLKLLDSSFYAKFIDLFEKEIVLCLARDNEDDSEILDKNDSMFHNTVSNKLIYAFAVMILILDHVRHTDSNDLINLLPTFIQIFLFLVGSLKKQLKDFVHAYNTKMARDSGIANDSLAHVKVELPLDDDSIDSDDLNDFDEDNEYEELIGSRGTKTETPPPIVKAEEKQEEIVIQNPRLFEIVRITLAWFLSWPEGGEIIKELVQVDMVNSLNDFVENVRFLHSPPISDDFLYEDFIFFGYPKFFGFFDSCIHNLDKMKFVNDPNQDVLRMSYILEIIKSDVLFKCNLDPEFAHNMKNALWYKRKTIGRRVKNKPRRKRSIKAGNNKDNIHENGSTQHNKRNKVNGDRRKTENLAKANVIPFASVIQDEGFIKDAVYSQVVRIFVPEAVINQMDFLKANTKDRVCTSTYIQTNAFPKLNALRIQTHESAVNLSLISPPNASTKTRYIDSIFATALQSDPNLLPNGRVIVVITPEEFLELFGTENVLTNTPEQIFNRVTLLNPSIQKGVTLMMKNIFAQEYL